MKKIVDFTSNSLSDYILSWVSEPKYFYGKNVVPYGRVFLPVEVRQLAQPSYLPRAPPSPLQMSW